MKKLVVLSGAGISAESGINTFRDADGLWEGYDVMEVASPEGYAANPDLVLDFYNQRRRQLLEVKPNQAHIDIANLEKEYQVVIVTQNVDDLHERAGSTQVIHLHGELLKVRSSIDESIVHEWRKDLVLGDVCSRGYQLRPHIVWFGEQVPLLQEAATQISNADIVIVIGTSMQVYPAASLISFAPTSSQKYYIDPKPASSYELSNVQNLEIYADKATTGMAKLLKLLK